MSQLIQITDKSGHKLGEKPLELTAVKAKLAASKGQAYWRSLEELSGQPGFNELLVREFPGQAPKDWAPLPRRDFVRLMGAALALAGLSGCAFQPQEKIVPYVKQPEQLVPGIPLFYATAFPLNGYGLGLLAESHEGRPTKIEGNPSHPSSSGATDLWAQAAPLSLYDPDRSQSIRHNGDSENWNAFVGAATTVLAEADADGGAGVAIVTGAVTSPVQLDLLAQIKRRFPKSNWYTYEPVYRDNVFEGARLAFGQPLEPVYHFDRADIIVSLDCDFLLEEPGHVAYARDFMSGRRVSNQLDANGQALPGAKMNRLYVVESTPTITGAAADHRLPVKAGQVEAFARNLAAAVGVPGVDPEEVDIHLGGHEVGINFIKAVADDLKAHTGRVIVAAGAHQPASVHAVANAINAQLASAGPSAPVSYQTPAQGNVGNGLNSMRALQSQLQGGQVDFLLFLDCNPVYGLPADIDLATVLGEVSGNQKIVTVHVGPYEDETSEFCAWHIPAAHFLEYWGDIKAHDGTVALIQPLIQPLYDAAKAPSEVLAVLAGTPDVTSYQLLHGYWQRQNPQLAGLDFDRFWLKAVHDGIIGTSLPAQGVALVSGFAAQLPALATPTAKQAGQLEINFRPDPTIWDGRFANNGWLQECPKPVSKITWDNAFFLNPVTAEQLNLATNDEVRVKIGGKYVADASGQELSGAIFLLPGQPEGTVTVHLGYGRTQTGKIGLGAGFNANLLRSTQDTKGNAVNPWITYIAPGDLEKTGGVYKLATTSNHNLIAPKGAKTTWIDGLMPNANRDSQTKIIDNIISPEERDLDIDGTHGRDVVRVDDFKSFATAGTKAGISDEKLYQNRIGLPFAYPDNPAGFPGGPDDGTDKRSLVSDRKLAGSTDFYPRNSDPLALTPYADPQNNSDELTRANQGKPAAAQRQALPYAWGMSVDLGACIGCNACVVGCQSENNSAIVGKDQVLMGREMHWIRIDTYYRGSFDNPEIHYEPMMCQHCEKAPCAPVCPFNAVMETPEGINEQVYNRCVGTKYCENNCPYKVRRFNFLQYSDQQTPVIQLMENPDVTVRSRGVMEKCTYCIQRVNYAKWQSELEDRRVADGEIKTACQQACPTNAIVFGDINDPVSAVSVLKRGPLNYGILTDFNTMPRTSYLKKIKNPNPLIAEAMQPAVMEGEG